MKITELRIGNLVNEAVRTKISRKIATYEITKIRALNIHHLEVFPISKNFEPIPLTEEWFLKFGFEKIEVEEPFFKKNKIEVFKYLKGNFFLLGGNNTSYGIGLHDIWQGMEINIKYIHQLQNLYFALTNEELTLTK
jgi:hypothetical protein